VSLISRFFIALTNYDILNLFFSVNFFFYKPVEHKPLLTASAYIQIDNSLDGEENDDEANAKLINPMLHSCMLRSIDTI
jgi:hypothetical protein